jgi:deazaflavin-dependent oxidoreductase (nitroreductase family)
MTSTLQVGGPDWIERHLKAYLATDGAEGHLLDFRPGGGREQTPTLILKTIGRRTGQPHLTPLIYGRHGREIVVIGSKGGAPEHPAWYLNLTARPDVAFQVVDKKYHGGWRVAQGAERTEVWNEMVELYPPYRDYQVRAGDREIPVVLLDPRETVDVL